MATGVVVAIEDAGFAVVAEPSLQGTRLAGRQLSNEILNNVVPGQL